MGFGGMQAQKKDDKDGKDGKDAASPYVKMMVIPYPGNFNLQQMLQQGGIPNGMNPMLGQIGLGQAPGQPPRVQPKPQKEQGDT